MAGPCVLTVGVFDASLCRMQSEQAIQGNSRGLARGHIRWMVRSDMTSVISIASTLEVDRWTEEAFLARLRQRNCIGMIIEDGNEIMGYMVYELHKTKLVVLSLVVGREWRRRGVGSMLVERLVSKLSSHRRRKARGMVRESDLGAQLFARASGFRATKVVHERYDDTGEAGYQFDYAVETADA